jgi:hypothetical protein
MILGKFMMVILFWFPVAFCPGINMFCQTRPRRKKKRTTPRDNPFVQSKRLSAVAPGPGPKRQCVGGKDAKYAPAVQDGSDFGFALVVAWASRPCVVETG